MPGDITVYKSHSCSGHISNFANTSKHLSFTARLQNDARQICAILNNDMHIITQK